MAHVIREMLEIIYTFFIRGKNLLCVVIGSILWQHMGYDTKC